MIDTFEQLTIIRYIQSILNKGLSTHAFKEVCDFFETGMPFLGIRDDSDEFYETIDEYQNAVRSNSGARRLFRDLQNEIRRLLQKRTSEISCAPTGAIEKNIRTISTELELDHIENEFFALFVRYSIHTPFHSFIDSLTRDHIGIIDLCASIIGQDLNSVAERLGQNGRLITSGIIFQKKIIGNELDDLFEMTDVVQNAMQKTMNNLDDVRNYIVGEPQRQTLEWDDFDHLGSTRDKLATFLKEATHKKIRGVNVLLWGPPGTGKTEFCKTLANRLNLTLYSLGEADDSGEEPSRRQRMSALQIAQNLLRYQSNNLLLFDEMDDLFHNVSLTAIFGVKSSSSSKIFTNRLLENNPVPTVWTINRPSILDDSVIRRMALAIEMKVPTASSRKNVWKRLLDKNQLLVPDKAIAKLSEIEVSPAIASSAVRFASLVGSSLEDFQFATHGIIKAMKGKVPVSSRKSTDAYLPELINSRNEIGRLVEWLCSSESKEFSLCLYGPPGTGKSAYVRFLAERLGMPVLFKRASDLLSPWVGENEQNIAKAFEEAREKESFLVFDEADSLLSDRRYAQRSWEVSQINEMLTWMESHAMPFACTTNLKERLDRASMRRFTFKCHFDYLNPKQIVIAFNHFFNLKLDISKAKLLGNLTPGDFSVVSKKSRFMKEELSIETLIRMLNLEVEEKNEPLQHHIGFV